MGKLLRKLVNGIVPSWITKIKSSAESSPKKLLPFSKGGTHASSHKSSGASSPSSGILAPADRGQSNQSSEHEKETCAEACGENNISERPSLIKQGRTANMRQKLADKNDDKHHPPDNNSPHHPHLVDVKIYDHLINHSTQSSALHPADLSTRNQEIQSFDKGNDEHNHFPWQHHRNRDVCEHQHRVEHHGNHDDNEDEEKSECMQEDVKHHQHQETQSSFHNAHEFHSNNFLEFEREFQSVRDQENSLHNHIHRKDHDQGAHKGYEYHSEGYHDLLGYKRTSHFLKEKDGEEEKEGGRDGSTRMTGWGWMRRTREREVMSCDLPESICSILGNSKAVVKHSQDPHLALWESMVEMIVGNDLWELGNLEYLLFCYLSLNEPHLHPIIHSTFLKVLKDLERAS